MQLRLNDIFLSFGGQPLLAGAELVLEQGDRIALVGRNGAGKSTLLKIAAGRVEPDKGGRFVQPGTTLAYLPQEPDFSGFDTVKDYVEAGLGPTGDVHRCKFFLGELGLSGDEQPSQLSGGEARRATLARIMAAEPDVMFLDEPTNHLDLPAIEWLERELLGLRSSFILISHDKRFLANLSNKTVWIDRGISRTLSQGFSSFEAWRDQVLNDEETEQARLSQRIATEEHWMRYGVTARRKRNMRRVALLGELRKEKREHVRRSGGVNLEATRGQLSGKLVVELKEVSKSFGALGIVSRLDLLLLRGDRLAIVGPNGSGKTTLLQLITGKIAPDSGSVRLGSNVQVVSFDQSRASLPPDMIVQDVITDSRGSSVTINGQTKHVVSYMQDFMFRPEQARTPVSVLSGGERARLILARELAKPSNFLVLDEPTNDLDIETLDLLQEMLSEYEGTLIVVSHDRDFLDQIATSTLMFEAPGRWVEYAGGYSDMVAQRGQGVGARKSRVEPRTKQFKLKNESLNVQPKRKLTFKEKHALETLPSQIESLEVELAALEIDLADSSLFSRDPKRYDIASRRHAQAQIEKDRAETQWLELEVLREELLNS